MRDRPSFVASIAILTKGSACLSYARNTRPQWPDAQPGCVDVARRSEAAAAATSRDPPLATSSRGVRRSSSQCGGEMPPASLQR